MATSGEAAFLDEISQLLESLDAADGVPILPESLPITVEPQELTSETVNAATSAPAYPSTTTSTVRRSRQRQEIEHLRAHVRELESQLAHEQQATGHVSTVTKGAVWQRLAQRQMTAKQKAEAENARLREMLQGQLKVARALEKLLRKRASQPEMEQAAPTSKRLKREAASNDKGIYEQLKEYLDDRYYEVDAVFRENGLATTDTDWEDVRLLGHDVGGPVTLELLHARVLPFDFASTSAAVWKCSSMSSLQLPAGYTYAPLSMVDDEVTAKFEVAVQVRRQYVTVHVQMVMRRYRQHEKQCEVFVWEAFSTIASNYKPFDGLQALDHGWTVVEALPSSDPDGPAANTIVRCCSRLSPDELFVPRHQPIGAFSDFLVASYNRNYATLLEIVENELLDDALATNTKEE